MIRVNPVTKIVVGLMNELKGRDSFNTSCLVHGEFSVHNFPSPQVNCSDVTSSEERWWLAKPIMQATIGSRATRFITAWFVFESNSQFTTTTRLISFHRLQQFCASLVWIFKPKTFLFLPFYFGLLCVLWVVGKQEDLDIKGSLLWMEKEKWCFLPLSFVQINSTPSPRFQCNISVFFSSFIF